MSMRAVPFYCPYCAEQSIEPIGEGRDYRCDSCGRRFEVRFKGLNEGEVQGTVSSNP
jgi:transposase-like protein